jgi:hypothetical protein
MSLNEFDRTVVVLGGGKLPAPPPVTAVIEQRDSHFEPDLIVIPVGLTVQFPNFDPIFHNVFSLSSAQPFDLGLRENAEPERQIQPRGHRPGVLPHSLFHVRGNCGHGQSVFAKAAGGRQLLLYERAGGTLPF